MATITHLYIDQGSDFVAEFTLENDDDTPMILHDFMVFSQFRKSYGSTTGYNFQCSIVDPASGKISISLDGNQSSQIYAGRYLYDIEIVSPSGNKTRVAEGVITINPEITRTL